jgi:hypothetical protein
MSESRFLVIGHSHTACLVEALEAGDGFPNGPNGFVSLLEFRRLRESDPTLSLVAFLSTEVPKAVAAMLGTERVPAPSEIPTLLCAENITVLASIAGNAHNFFGLVEFEVPFDFVLPSREDLGADPTRDLVPYDAVAKLLGDRVQPVWKTIDGVRSAVGKRIFVLESPPPIRDDAHVIKYCGHHFRSRLGPDYKIVTATLRYKIWRVSSELYIDHCNRRSIEFVPAPADTMEDGMFLRPEGWASDATHANRWYGESVVREVRKRLADGIATWN